MPCGGGPIIGIIGGPPIGGVGSMPGRGGPAAFETEKCQCTINVKTLYKCTEIYMSKSHTVNHSICKEPHLQ